MRNWSQVWDTLRSVGHAMFYACMGMVCIAFIVMGVIEYAGRDRPMYWGTFTETSTTCDPGPRGSCTSTGRWVSDDGTMSRVGVTLDGTVEPGGSVRASYQPGGPMGDDANNIVHTGMWSRAGLWFPWPAAALSGAAIWHQHRRWRSDADGRRYEGRHSRRAR